MASDKLRIALVGLGFSRLILQDYLSAPNVELALLCDLDEDKCRELSNETGVPYALSFEECLGPTIDAVDISTPNHLHADQAVAAIEAGKHVLLQKPMASSVADGWRILEADRRTGRRVGLFMSSLNDPIIHELKAMVEAGAFGKLVSMRGRSAHRSAHTKWGEWKRPDDYWRRKKKLSGGGSMALIGIHIINLLPWLAGSRVASVSAMSGNVASAAIMEGDDITTAVTRLENESLAVMESTYASEHGSLEIYGTAGYAVMQSQGLRLKLDATWKGRVLEVEGSEDEVAFSPEELDRLRSPLKMHYEQHQAFARAILSGQPPPVTGEDGLRDLAVLEAIYRSADTGRRESPAL